MDILLHNGTLYDGTGTPPLKADIGISDGRIEAIGDLKNVQAKQCLDCTGMAIAPGFIDAHSHSDTYILTHPEASSKITQGVTTEICGQCGSSAAPLFEGATLPSDWEAVGHPGQWQTFAQYRDLLASVKPAVNIALFCGHNTLRKGVMGYAPRVATPGEIALMSRRLEAALEDGAAGLSTGLLYNPGTHAAPDEILALAKTAARHGGIYATHMRSEGAQLLEALDEAIGLAESANIALQISHLKTGTPENWHKLQPALEKIRAAQQRGLRVHADRYPYLAGGTDLDVVLPAWASSGGRDAILARLNDPAQRGRVIEELHANPRLASGVMIGATWHASLLATRGKTLDVVAAEWGCAPAEAFVKFLELDQTRTGAFFFGMSQKNLETIYREPWVMPGSDASLRALEGPLSLDHPHPRAFGTFPKFLRMATTMQNPLSVPEAIRRMTSLPADAFALRNRGRVVEGAFADLVAFDLETFSDRADYAKPHQICEGLHHVIVNGALTFSNGKFTGNRRGVFVN